MSVFGGRQIEERSSTRPEAAGLSRSPEAETLQGLGEAEAQSRLVAEGFNELPRSNRRTVLRIAFDVMREPMLALLLGGGAIYLVLGDLREALILLAFATLSVAITVVQEARTERVLEALARPHQSTRTGDSRRRAQAHCRSRGGARRSGACSTKATACRPIAGWSGARTSRPTNRC